MPELDYNDPQVRAWLQRQRQIARELSGGKLPVNAATRLRGQAARQGTPREFFTSDLSVNELGLAHLSRYRPLGQVMGAAVYLLGRDWRTANWRDSDQGKPFAYEMSESSSSLQETLRLALGRLSQEAALLGATSVIGTRLTLEPADWVEGTEGIPNSVLECMLMGTAVREVGTGAPSGGPALTSFSGQELEALRQAGYRPAGLAVGACVYFHIPSPATQKLTTGVTVAVSLRNQELEEYTLSLYEARSLAVGRMEDEARAVRADGVVDTRITTEARLQIPPGQTSVFPGLLIQFIAMGTAVTATGAPPEQHSLSILPLH